MCDPDNARFLVCAPSHRLGWGNRMMMQTTCAQLALFTRRRLLIASDQFNDAFDSPVSCPVDARLVNLESVAKAYLAWTTPTSPPAPPPPSSST